MNLILLLLLFLFVSAESHVPHTHSCSLLLFSHQNTLTSFASHWRCQATVGKEGRGRKVGGETKHTLTHAELNGTHTQTERRVAYPRFGRNKREGEIDKGEEKQTKQSRVHGVGCGRSLAMCWEPLKCVPPCLLLLPLLPTLPPTIPFPLLKRPSNSLHVPAGDKGKRKRKTRSLVPALPPSLLPPGF